MSCEQRCSGSPRMYNGKRCASTTRYNDYHKGACGCGPASGDTQFSWNHDHYVTAPNQMFFDEGNSGWCGQRCGKCVKLTTTGTYICFPSNWISLNMARDRRIYFYVRLVWLIFGNMANALPSNRKHVPLIVNYRNHPIKPQAPGVRNICLFKIIILTILITSLVTIAVLNF